MRCLVTGATGHVGSALVENLVSLGAEVSVLARPQSNFWRLSGLRENISVITGSFDDITASRATIIKSAPEIVFHLAWQGVTSAYRNAPEQITRNVAGSLSLWEAAQEAECRCWVGVGSQAEYGPYDGVLVEDLPLRPTTGYGIAKQAVGQLTQTLCDMAGMQYIWLRLVATYGPKDDEKHLIPSVIRRLLAGQRPALTQGEQLWDYLYIEDAAEAICRIAFEPQARGVFNLGSGQTQSVRRTVELIRDCIDPSLSLGFGEIHYGSNQVMRLQADISRLQAATGWSPRTGLEQGLRQTVDWYREHLAVPNSKAII